MKARKLLDDLKDDKKRIEMAGRAGWDRRSEPC